MNSDEKKIVDSLLQQAMQDCLNGKPHAVATSSTSPWQVEMSHYKTGWLAGEWWVTVGWMRSGKPVAIEEAAFSAATKLEEAVADVRRQLSVEYSLRELVAAVRNAVVDTGVDGGFVRCNAGNSVTVAPRRQDMSLWGAVLLTRDGAVVVAEGTSAFQALAALLAKTPDCPVEPEAQ